MLVSGSPLFYLLMAPKRTSGEAGTLGMSKRSRAALPVSENAGAVQ